MRRLLLLMILVASCTSTLPAALQRSEAGTTIRLPEGTFELTESVRLKAGVKLIGAGQDKTVLIYSGDQPAPFINLTDCEDVEIVQRLWDFNHGIAEVVVNPQHTFDQPGKYRVTLIVWDTAGRGARAEKLVEVLPAQ